MCPCASWGNESIPDHPIHGAVIQSFFTHDEISGCRDQVILDDVTSRLDYFIVAIFVLSRA